MKCDFCDSKATVFFTQLAEGQMKKICLCDSCAKERGVTDPTGFALADMLLGGSAAGTVPTAPAKGQAPSAGGGRKCPTCGFTLDDLRRVRRFGCSDCYAIFSDEVAQMIRGMHKGTTHAGKVPDGLMAQQVLHQRLEELRSKLDQAISSESYEEAAGIRDEIRNLEVSTKL
jgi:protein arginine kinase activator